MKLKMIAAVLGLALAGVANAAPVAGGSNGNLFFTVYDIGANADDAADDRAYLLNLSSLLDGGSIDNWATAVAVPVLSANKQAAGTVYSVAADAALTSFLAGTNDLSRLQWNVAAVDSSNPDRVLVTSTSTEPTTMKNNTLHTVAGKADVYLAQVNSALASSNSAVLNGASAFINLWGDSFAGYLPFTDVAGIGQSQNFYLLSKNGTNINTQNRVNQYMADATTAMTWTLQNDGTLVYAAAVPEPETYALFLAGLGMLGAIARRRLAK